MTLNKRLVDIRTGINFLKFTENCMVGGACFKCQANDVFFPLVSTYLLGAFKKNSVITVI